MTIQLETSYTYKNSFIILSMYSYSKNNHAQQEIEKYMRKSKRLVRKIVDTLLSVMCNKSREILISNEEYFDLDEYNANVKVAIISTLREHDEKFENMIPRDVKKYMLLDFVDVITTMISSDNRRLGMATIRFYVSMDYDNDIHIKAEVMVPFFVRIDERKTRSFYELTVYLYR